MFKNITHIGLTVSDINKSISFYKDILGLTYIGQLEMSGQETEKLFNKKDCKAIVAYLNAAEDHNGPSVELIQFVGCDIKREKSDLFKTSISEICFVVDDINKEYERMKALGVEFISEPQDFDFTKDGFSKSKALYFKDPDGIILELMQY